MLRLGSARVLRRAAFHPNNRTRIHALSSAAGGDSPFPTLQATNPAPTTPLEGIPSRHEQLQRLKAGETYDLLVIGGGATGAGGEEATSRKEVARESQRGVVHDADARPVCARVASRRASLERLSFSALSLSCPFRLNCNDTYRIFVVVFVDKQGPLRRRQVTQSASSTNTRNIYRSCPGRHDEGA